LAPKVLTRLVRELQNLIEEPLEGIHVTMNESNIADVQAVIDGPEGTPFERGEFRVRLVLGPEFPAAPPKGFFVTKIFHPNVSLKGEICVNTLKKDWKPELGIKDILVTIKCLLVYPNPESALNEEAGRLLLEAYDDYARHARLMTSIHAMRSSVPEPFEPSTSENTNTTNLAPADAGAKKAEKPVVTAAAAASQAAKKKNLKRL